MQYYWMRDRDNQCQFKVHWEIGSENDADYFTKNHATAQYCSIQSRYVKDIVSHVGSYTVNEYSFSVQPTSNIPTIYPILLQASFKKLDTIINPLKQKIGTI